MIDSPALLARSHPVAGSAAQRGPAQASPAQVSPAQGDPRGAGAWLTGGMHRAQLHELHATDPDDAATAAGFAVTLALAGAATPILWLRTESAERRGGRLHATGLIELGLSPDQLVLGIVADEAAQLRAAADAARCAGLGTAVVEMWGRMPSFDLTASRRLMLAAERSGVTVLALRIAAAPVPSAAASRWSVAAVPSIALDANAPGPPLFDVECLRQRGGPSGQRWRVEWNRDTQCFTGQTLTGPIYAGPAYAGPAYAGAPLSGAGLSVAPDRAAAVHPRAPVRRAG